jgi:hypothetical protein
MTSKTAFQDVECYGFQKHFKHLYEWLYKEWGKTKPLDIVGSNESIFSWLLMIDQYVEHYCNVDIWQRRTTTLREKSLPHWHFVHYRSHMDYTRIETRTPYLTHCHLCTLDPHCLPQDWIQASISAPTATLSTLDSTWITPGLSGIKQLIEIWHGTTAHSYWF